MSSDTEPQVELEQAPSAGEPGWREVFAVQRPLRVAAVVAAVAAATFGYWAILVFVFDAREWWGRSLGGMALAFAAEFAVIALLTFRSTTQPRRLVAFLATAWVGLSLVSWLPRQRPDAWPELAQLAWWAGWAIVIFVMVPTIYALVTRQNLRDYGLRLGLFRGELAIFAILLPAILVGAYLAAGQPRFQEVYPFYGGWTDGSGTALHLVGWWLMYASTFVALEFFFRGFMVSAGFRLVGWWAIPAMAAPYCLIHLDKPVPEMVTSLFGGLLLGVVALRTRSILAGVLAHVTLAIGTDAAVLLRR